jgi:hypothetical protein
MTLEIRREPGHVAPAPCRPGLAAGPALAARFGGYAFPCDRHRQVVVDGLGDFRAGCSSPDLTNILHWHLLMLSIRCF